MRPTLKENMSSLSMSDFLSDVKYAAEHTLAIVWHDWEDAHALAHQVHELKALVADGYGRSSALALDPLDAEDLADATGALWDTYFGPGKDLDAATLALDELEARLAVRRFSIAATSGSVLQFAKQGISLVHAGLGSCPDGRQVTASQTLKNVAWQGRNQAMHWEEGNLRTPVLACFAALSTEAGPLGSQFQDPYVGSLAFDVLRVLGWKTWTEFETDMLLLA